MTFRKNLVKYKCLSMLEGGNLRFQEGNKELTKMEMRYLYTVSGIAWTQ